MGEVGVFLMSHGQLAIKKTQRNMQPRWVYSGERGVISSAYFFLPSTLMVAKDSLPKGLGIQPLT